MPGLRQTVLEAIRTLGNHSGCHQIPERSFFYKGYQFPVCARCTGVFIGQASALIFNLRHTLPSFISILLLAVMGIDWGIQEMGLKDSTNRRRFLTGAFGGFGLFCIYCSLIKKFFHLMIQNKGDSL